MKGPIDSFPNRETGVWGELKTGVGFRGLLKAEIGTTVWETRAHARADVFRFIEVEYNRSSLRRHPEHRYLTPVQTRALLQQDLAPAA